MTQATISFFILKNGHPGTGRIAPQITKAI
jgi:hypothetical protein